MRPSVFALLALAAAAPAMPPDPSSPIPPGGRRGKGSGSPGPVYWPTTAPAPKEMTAESGDKLLKAEMKRRRRAKKLAAQSTPKNA